MAHIVIECSDNIRSRTDVRALLKRTHAEAIDSGIFPLGGLRTRLEERNEYVIADGNPNNAFVHITLRIGEGRDAETKQRAAQRIFDAVCAQLAPAFDTTPLAISLEMQEIDSALSFKHNNLHAVVRPERTSVR